MRAYRLALLALLLVVVTHYSYDLLASFYSDSKLSAEENGRRVAQAARDWFYVLRGFEGAVLFSVVGLLVRRPLVWAVCLWGAAEEAQTAVCGLAYPLRMPAYEPFKGLCGTYWIGLIVALWFAAVLIDRGSRK